MGLSASQARVLLLTAKNNHYELQAQMIEEERLLLAQEEERIAEEYSEKTSNTIYTCSSDNFSTSETLNLETLARAMSGTKIAFTDASGNVLGYARDHYDSKTDKHTVVYSGKDENVYIHTVNGKELKTPLKLSLAECKDHKATMALIEETLKDENTELKDGESWDSDETVTEYTIKVDVDDEASNKILKDSIVSNSTYFQDAVASGRIRLYVYDEDMDNGGETVDGNTSSFMYGQSGWVQKSFEQLDCAKSRYYTEDDAAAQAEYQAAMKRVNVLDTKLEQKLNKLETNKKAVETELESAKNLIKTNIERTFQYFG